MKRLTITGAYSCLLLLAPATHAAWYLGGAAGRARTDVDSGELNTRLAAAGQPGSARIETNERLGWRLFGGYQWGDYFAVEGGYTDLGQLDVKYYGSGAMTADTLESITLDSGAGYELSLRGSYPFMDQFSAFARVGELAWKSKYTVSAGSDVTFSGTDPFFGIGAAWHIDDFWSLQLGWDRYTVGKDKTDLIGFGISYRFAEPHVSPYVKKDE